jgi:DNA-binding SARP family transcriptional activator
LEEPCGNIGRTLASPRIYLTGHVGIEHRDTFVGDRHLPGRQGRLAFVFLMANRARPVTRDEFVGALWSGDPPAGADAAVSALLSKLRGAFKVAALDAALEWRSGAVTVRLPPDAHVDIEDAGSAIDEAEGAWRKREARAAWAHANVAVAVARRPLLPQEEGAWIEAQRNRLQSVLTRALYVLSAASFENGEASLAVEYSTEILRLEPFQETGYQQLMRLHARMGNRGEALRVFAKCREVLRDELGASPSPQTEAIFLEILRSGDPHAAR